PMQTYEIVGLVADTKYREISEKTQAISYLAATQDGEPDQFDNLLVRGERADSAASALRAALADVSPNIVYRLTVLETRIEGSLTRERLMALLSGFFGVLALALATIGL